MIRAVIFDMDGVLIDSEPLWRKAELEILRAHGVPLTDAMCRTTTGLRIDKVVEHWYKRFPWPDPDLAHTTQTIVTTVAALVREQGEVLPDATAAIATVRSKGLSLALATSSPSELIDAVLSRLELKSAFDVIASAEGLAHGKPHPEVYLQAAAGLGVAPEDCLAIEDSLVGVIAAKAAAMKCIAVPTSEAATDARFCLADLVISSLEGFDTAFEQIQHGVSTHR